MKATTCGDDVTTARDHSARRRPQSSVDLSVEARPPIGDDRHPHFVWDVWCDLVVAGAVWVVLLGLALFALSAVARPLPASYSTGPRPAEVVAPDVSEMCSSSAGVEIVR